MGARRTARERALQALYHLELTPTSSAEALENVWSAEQEKSDGEAEPEARRFAMTLVEGVETHLPDIDRLIETHSHNWRLDRMSRIDRNLLRLAIFELGHLAEVPRKVTINEAIELGKRFGTEETSAFVNGLLDRVALALNKP